MWDVLSWAGHRKIQADDMAVVHLQNNHPAPARPRRENTVPMPRAAISAHRTLSDRRGSSKHVLHRGTAAGVLMRLL